LIGMGDQRGEREDKRQHVRKTFRHTSPPEYLTRVLRRG
jgi:hypothetical protein